ncbi:MAG: prolyl oligopeptidase family serine peptidase [Myxococcaceae bacterium]
MRKLLAAPIALMVACTTAKEATREDAPAPSTSPLIDAAKPAQGWPETRSQELVEMLHGTAVADPYRWLEDEKAPEVQAWMTAQDDYARKILNGLPGRDVLKQRFTDLFYVEAYGTPAVRLVKDAKGKQLRRLFYARTHKDKEKAILYVRDGESGQERMLLDPNTWSEDGTISLGAWYPSWDGKKVAFKKKPNAADEAIIHVVDVETGKWSEVDVIEGGKYADPSWTPDSSGFYYEFLPSDPSIKVDERPGYTEIRFHKLGTDPKGDAQIHPRTGDPKTFLAQRLSRDGKYLFVYVLRGWSENDVFIKRLGKDQAFKPLVKGDGAKYSVEAWKDQIYITTDEGAPNQRVFKVAASNPDRKNWKELVPERKDATLVGSRIVGNHLVTEYLKNAYSELAIHTLGGKQVRTISLPTIGSAGLPSGLEEDDVAFFDFSSFTSPRQVYKTTISGGQSALWAKVDLPIDPSPYTVEQVWYPSKDGTKVSMFLVHRKDLKRDGTNPTLLYGYGGFDVSLTPNFRSSIYPWLEAGGVYAVANLRGGGEYGKAWHDAGRLDKKQNVFDDFIAAAEYLNAGGYTTPEKLAIWGGSNGGLLVGAAMTQRPDLFGAVVCAVPLLDMVRYHAFGSGRTWIPEYGSSEDPQQFNYIHAYSPYHRVKKGEKYPALLMLAADHDDRVDPMHARKFTAYIQNATAGDAPAIIRIERNAGHGGADQVRQAIEQYADQFAFLFERFGMKPPGGQ